MADREGTDRQEHRDDTTRPLSRRHDEERFESIPWDALVVDDNRSKRLITLGAVAFVTVLVVAGITVFFTRQSDPAEVVVGSDTTVSSAVPVETLGSGVDAPLLAESDLTAAPSTDTSWKAAAYASWFVADFFTLDGSETTQTAIASRLPDGVDIPRALGSERSFVESAVPIQVEAIDEVQYRVTVVVRSLAANDGETYSREPARAVEVVVAINETGDFSVRDLPAPADLPAGDPTQLQIDEQTLPADILEAARVRAAVWGDADGPVLSAGRVGSTWRVVIEVVDAAGIAWPTAVWLDEDGIAVPAGS